MTDYISREDAIDTACGVICDCCENDLLCNDCYVHDKMQKEMKHIPAADVRENIQARWMPDGCGNYVCSYCRKGPWYGGNIYDYEYCPFCGASMKGETW